MIELSSPYASSLSMTVVPSSWRDIWLTVWVCLFGILGSARAAEPASGAP